MAQARIGVEIYADGRGFKAGLSKVENETSRFVRNMGMKLAGVFSIAAMGQQIRAAIQQGSRIRDMADAIGLTAEQFQELEFAAKQTGASMETVSMAIKKIAQAQQEALVGGGKNNATESFARLGITFEELRRLSPHEIFTRLSSSVESGKIGIQNMADILDVMGKNANTLIPAMTQGFSAMAQQARDFGLIIQEEIIDRLDDMGDRLDVVTTKWSAIRAESIINAEENIRKPIWRALHMLYADFTGGGKEGGAEALKEAFGEMFAEEDAAMKEEVAIRKANRVRARAAIAAGVDIDTVAAAKTKSISATSFTPASDSLAKIGGFVGGAGRTVQIQQETLREIKIIRGRLTRLGWGMMDAIW